MVYVTPCLADPSSGPLMAPFDANSMLSPESLLYRAAHLCVPHQSRHCPFLLSQNRTDFLYFHDTYVYPPRTSDQHEKEIRRGGHWTDSRFADSGRITLHEASSTLLSIISKDVTWRVAVPVQILPGSAWN